MPQVYICGRVCTTVIEPSSSTAPSMSCALPRASSMATPTLAMRLTRSFLKPSSAMSLQKSLTLLFLSRLMIQPGHGAQS